MMAAATDSTSLVPIQPVFTDAERLALAGYLAGYRGLTREAYTLDLGSSPAGAEPGPCRCSRSAAPRSRPSPGNSRAAAGPGPPSPAACPPSRGGTPSRRNSLDHSPAAHVRRPRLDYESHATAMDQNEVGALLVAAGLGEAAEHALISLLALNGLRVSEATGADIEHLGLERGHRTLVITRKGGKVVTIPLAPRTARAIELAIGERTTGPLFCAADGKRRDRHGAARIVAVSPAAPGSASRSARTRCGTRSSPPPSTRESRCATCRRPPRTPTRAPPCATTGHAPASTDTPPTSSPPTSPEPPGSPRRRPSRPDRPASGQAMTAGQTAVRAECHTGTVISPSVTGSMRELYGFELEPEIRDWLDSLSDDKRVDEVCGLLAEKGSERGGPWSDQPGRIRVGAAAPAPGCCGPGHVLVYF